MRASKSKLTPVELVITRFDAANIGVRKLGRLLGMSDFVVAAWRHKKLKSVPSVRQMHQRLLALAKANKVKLTPEELINGGPA